jgi:hypothetical protein
MAGVLIARSSPECHLYMSLHPCSCGDATAPARHGVYSEPAGLVARYEGACPTCGLQRRFDFVLDPEMPPLDAFGGASPSKIVDPGQFAAHSDRLASRWPASPTAIPPADRGRARDDLAWAIRALEEVQKFIPAGGDAVPAEAFTSSDGRAVYDAEPGRFRALRLGARLTAYRQILGDLDNLN